MKVTELNGEVRSRVEVGFLSKLLEHRIDKVLIDKGKIMVVENYDLTSNKEPVLEETKGLKSILRDTQSSFRYENGVLSISTQLPVEQAILYKGDIINHLNNKVEYAEFYESSNLLVVSRLVAEVEDRKEVNKQLVNVIYSITVEDTGSTKMDEDLFVVENDKIHFTLYLKGKLIVIEKKLNK